MFASLDLPVVSRFLAQLLVSALDQIGATDRDYELARTQFYQTEEDLLPTCFSDFLHHRQLGPLLLLVFRGPSSDP